MIGYFTLISAYGYFYADLYDIFRMIMLMKNDTLKHFPDQDKKICTIISTQIKPYHSCVQYHRRTISSTVNRHRTRQVRPWQRKGVKYEKE